MPSAKISVSPAMRAKLDEVRRRLERDAGGRRVTQSEALWYLLGRAEARDATTAGRLRGSEGGAKSGPPG